MRIKVNLLGKTYGHVVVIQERENDERGVRWLCKCVCGKELVKYAQDLKRGRSISCGCSHGNRKYDPVKSSAVRIFKSNYADTDMTPEQFIELSRQNCYYCGAPPSNKFKDICGAIFIYNGLDRVDSSLPHLLSNCVPCCYVCNKMKWDLSQEEFLSRMKRILNNLDAKLVNS